MAISKKIVCILPQNMKYKKGASAIMVIFVILGVIATAAVVYMAVPKEKAPLGGSTGQGTQEAPVVTTSTTCEVAPSIQYGAVVKYREGTAITDASVLYQVKQADGTWGAVAQAGLSTAITFDQKGTVYRYLINSTTYTDSDLKEVTVDWCGAKPKVTVALKDALDAAADLSFKIINDDDGLLNSLTNNQSLTNNDIIDFEMALRPLSEKGAEDCVLTQIYNVTVYDEVVAKENGANLPVAQGITWMASGTAIPVGYTAKYFTLGNLQNSEQRNLVLHVDVKNVDPSPASGTADIIQYVNCGDSYVDSKTGQLMSGLENDAGAEVVDGTINTLTNTFRVG